MVQAQIIKIASITAPTTLGGDNTQGIFQLEELLIPPGSQGQLQTNGQTTLYLVEGQLELFRSENETIQLRQGDTLQLPNAQPQSAYQNTTDSPARVLQLVFSAGPSTREQLIKAAEGVHLGVITDVGTIKLSRQDTEGAYLLMEWAVPPLGGVPIHAQGAQETFYILQGQFQFQGLAPAGETYELSAPQGVTIHVPERAPHAYRNVGASPGRMLVLTTPAGRTEEFFRRLGSPVAHANDFPTSISLPEQSELLKLFQEFNVQVFG